MNEYNNNNRYKKDEKNSLILLIEKQVSNNKLIVPEKSEKSGVWFEVWKIKSDTFCLC